MSPWPSASQAAMAAGLPPRYVYWHGHSGRRYLFTATDGRSIADFDEAVALRVENGRIGWAGHVRELVTAPAAPPRAPIYVHLLAATPEEREAVIADLRPERSSPVRLAA